MRSTSRRTPAPPTTSSSSSPATATARSSTTSKAPSLNAQTPDLAALLAAHGLNGVAEEPIAHAGFSGSHLTRLRRDDGTSFVLKRMSIKRDWIMRATNDMHCREAQFVAAVPSLAPAICVPSIANARDAELHTILMHDITPMLIDPDRPAIVEPQLDAILAAMAVLHATPPPDMGIDWCNITGRLTLLTPQTMRIAADYGAPVARDVTDGWRLFDRHASPAAVSLIHQLFADPAPLVRALDTLPHAFLHGDLKLDNIGLGDDGAMWLIDWAMTLIAPAAIDLGWFLAINSRRLPVSLDDVMQHYAEAARISAAIRERHDALTVLCGLLLRGWRKALDAEAGDPTELQWWCERASEAMRLLTPQP